MLLHTLVLFSGIIAGLILFQSAVNAPIIFKTLGLEHARPLLRQIFPILFKVVTALGIIMTALAWVGGAGLIAIGVSIMTALVALTCALLVPATNRAADDGDEQRFHRLHQVSVLLTVVVLVANMGWPFFV